MTRAEQFALCTIATRFYRGALEASQTRVKGSKAAFGGSRGDRNPESEDEELLEELTKAKESYAEEWEKNELGKHKVSGNVSFLLSILESRC